MPPSSSDPALPDPFAIKPVSFTGPDDRRIAYADCGDPRGWPVLFHHGWPSSSLQAAVLHRSAHEKGIRLVGIDRPGVGGTAPLPGALVGEQSRDVIALRDHLGWESFAVLGVSGGGPYALATAALVPGVAAVGACCGAPLPTSVREPGGISPIYRALVKLVERFPCGAVVPAFLIRGFVRTVPLAGWIRVVRPILPREDAAVLGPRETRRLIARPVYHAFAQSPATLLRDATRYLRPWGFALSQIRVPTHFWHGSKDRNIPPHLTRIIADRIRGSTYHAFPDEGHYSLPLGRGHEMLTTLNREGNRSS